MGVPNTMPESEVREHNWMQVTLQKAIVVPGATDENGDPVFFTEGEPEVKVVCWECQVPLSHPNMTLTACRGRQEEVDEDGHPIIDDDDEDIHVEGRITTYDEEDGDELGAG